MSPLPPYLDVEYFFTSTSLPPPQTPTGSGASPELDKELSKSDKEVSKGREPFGIMNYVWIVSHIDKAPI